MSFKIVLLIFLCASSCFGYRYLQRPVSPARLLPRHTPRNLQDIGLHGLPLEFGGGRSSLSYQPMSGTSQPYRRLRSGISASEGSDSVSDRQVRFFDWMFGRPSYSTMPDYGPLESAAGMYDRPYRPLYPSPPVVVEECEEYLDPYTHEYIEECTPIGPYYR